MTLFQSFIDTMNTLSHLYQPRASLAAHSSKLCSKFAVVILFLALLSSPSVVKGQCGDRACYPPFVDLIVEDRNRTVSTNSTCGDPPSQFELRIASDLGDTFAKETCNASDPVLSHPVASLYDVTTFLIFNQVFTSPRLETWWQSQNGDRNVHLTLDLVDQFLFQQTVLSFRSDRPASLIIEKSNGGEVWTALRYYAIDCAATFPGVPMAEEFVFRPDCREEYVFGHSVTEVDGEDIQQLIYNPVQELGQTYFEFAYQQYFSLRALRITMLESGRQEEARSYFAVADWNVQGQCLCYGHAAECTGPNEAVCICEHNTVGLNCESCLPLYNNTPWSAAIGTQTNACEDCGCGGRADSCVYDEVKGYGVCQDCQENTSGDKCEVCLQDYYRNPYTDPTFNDTCIACNCSAEGTVPNSVCNETNGQCECKTNVQGRPCNECMDTFYDLQSSNDLGCQECDCDPVGTSGNINLCDKATGVCICKDNVEGTRCDECKLGTFNLDPSDPVGCTPCDCDPGAAISGSCDPVTGACTCRANIVGRACNDTLPGFYVPRLDGISAEAETAIFDQAVSIREQALGSDARHTGPGFAVVPASTMVTFSGVSVPQTQDYALVIRYETTSDWSNVNVEINQQIPTQFECQGSLNSGTSTTLVDLTSTEYGGAFQLPTQCLRGDTSYDIIINLGVADSGLTTAELLLDSVVLLPDLAALEIFMSNQTSQASREAMETCWEAAMTADPLGQARVNCSEIEFGVMAEVFDGAIACDCSPIGSNLSPVCASYGGQCPCLPGVTTRSCDLCEPFFFGIESGSGCTDCGCHAQGSVTQSCNQTVGVCECRPNVMGEKCNTCSVDHYGLASGQGCVACDCAPDFSMGTSCTDEGQCGCKEGVQGLRCTECGQGFFNLTTDGCVGCSCDSIGSVNGTCNADGQCTCRQSASGLHCDECPQGTYGFGVYSERGCIECLCSSHTTNCTAAATGWFQSRLESHYSLLNLEGAVSERWTGIDGDGNEVEVVSEAILEISDPRFVLEIVDPGNMTDLFFVAPSQYLGDHRTAYGQTFQLTLSQSTSENQTRSPEGDVYIYGTHVTEPLVTALPHVPSSPVNNGTTYQLKLHESYWNLGSVFGSVPTMQDVVQILASISDIRIRAKYTTLPGQSVFFHDGSLTEATFSSNASSVDVPADFVEECFCPPEYTHQFCEQCAEGYRRSAPGQGSFSTCIPCDCNGHSDQPCHPETGVCQTCNDNTQGEYCERCSDGYYGNATLGTADDCQPCMCPGIPGTNSFAATCDENGICVDCALGHGGEHCEFCMEGYYGVPTDQENNGGICEPCFCNLSPHVCDSMTGQCLNCSGNTDGSSCEVCAFGYWGSIDNCQECTCNLTGGYGNCTQDSGVCYCLPNVAGDECTQCAPETWGFESGNGCTKCDCHPVGTANQQTQCDLITGQCSCKALVEGQMCDQCVHGFYDIDQECIACDCNVNGTNPLTCLDGLCSCSLLGGQCDCQLATIAGRTCDRCGRLDQGDEQVVEEIFVGDFPNCEPCPECFQNWRQELELLGELLVEERERLLWLLSNYGNLTEEEVGHLLQATSGNLTYADEVIAQGNLEAESLQSIQDAFLLISQSIENQTAALDSILALEGNITSLMAQTADFNGEVEVESGVGRDSAQLDQELLAVTNTIDNVIANAEDLWQSVQSLHQQVVDSQIRAQELISDVDTMVRDVETAAEQRGTVEGILADAGRTAEIAENGQRLELLDSTQAEYPLEETSQNLAAAESLAGEANVTAWEAYGQAGDGRVESTARVYHSEVARFNATGASMAATNAYTAAATYKDVALSTTANITQAYVDTLAALSRLTVAETDTREAGLAAAATQAMVVRDPALMEVLVQEINATGLSDAAVTPLLENSTGSLARAQETRMKASQSLDDALAVGSQIATAEYDLTEAERIRELTDQSVNDTWRNITSINQISTQVQTDAQVKLEEGHTTLSMVDDFISQAIGGLECFSAKRSQVQDARRRVAEAQEDVEATQDELDAVVMATADLEAEINVAKNTATSNNLNAVTIGNDADSLSRDILSISDMDNLNDLLEAYMDQRREMTRLAADLESMETTLDGILANLQGGETGDIQCN